MPDRTAAFIRALPKTETHLHIEGALPWELLHRIAPDRFAEPPASWNPGYRFADFHAFVASLIRMATTWFTSPDRYHEAACLVFRRLAREHNVRYVETSFASGVVEHLGLDGRAVAEAVRTAAEGLLDVRVVLGIHHLGYHDGTSDWLDDCVSWPHLDGIDLHGPETDPLGPWAADLWRRARERGLLTKAHAGEFDGASFVRRVLDELRVERIEHGVRSAGDPDLMRRLVAEDVVLDVCPVSNVKLGVATSYDDHPLRTLLEAGVRCTISTDDPLVFGQTLFDEYAMLAAAGHSHETLAHLAAEGFRAARAEPAWIQRQLDAVQDALSTYPSA